MLYAIGFLLLAPLTWIFLRPKIHNAKALRVKGKAIYVSNHWALTDPILISMVSPRVVHYMAKKELFANPVAAFFMRQLLTFPVDRGHADMQSLKVALGLLEKGKVFGIFPEGKRSVTGEIDELESGAAFLALRSGAPIIPIYSDPDTFRRFRLRMAVGDPMDAKQIAEHRKGKAVNVVTEAIADELLILKNQLEAGI